MIEICAPFVCYGCPLISSKTTSDVMQIYENIICIDTNLHIPHSSEMCIQYTTEVHIHYIFILETCLKCAKHQPSTPDALPQYHLVKMSLDP